MEDRSGRGWILLIMDQSVLASFSEDERLFKNVFLARQILLTIEFLRDSNTIIRHQNTNQSSRETEKSLVIECHCGCPEPRPRCSYCCSWRTCQSDGTTVHPNLVWFHLILVGHSKATFLQTFYKCANLKVNLRIWLTWTLYRPKTHIHVINQLSAKRPMTHIRVMCIFGVFFECRGLLGTVYTINHIYCTHRKLNVHDGLQIDIVQAGSWTLWGVRLYRNRQGRVYHDWYRELHKLWIWNKKQREAKWKL